MSREHVLPDWMAASAPHPKATLVITTDEKVYRWSGKVFDHTVSVVCESCNNTWLSELENYLKPYLKQMAFKGEAQHLPKLAQEKLSLWAEKTLIVSRYATPGTKDILVPKDHAQELYITKKPVKVSIVHIGCRTLENKSEPFASIVANTVSRIDQIPRDMVKSFQKELKNGGRIYKALIAVGHLVLTVHGHNFENVQVEMAASHDGYESPLLPYRHDVNWPATFPLELNGGLATFQDAYS